MVDLPEVTEEFTSNTAPFVAGLEAAIAAAERFRNVCIEATIAAEDLSAVGSHLADSAANVARAEATEAAATRAAGDAATTSARDQYLLAMAERMRANTAKDAAAAELRNAAAASTAGAAAGVATGFWARWGTVIHWVVAGGAEFLAVFIPAAVAAGSAAAVMAQGVQDAETHLRAMYTTQEATANIFHTTTGQMLGLGDALQRAQNAADPKVFELLGAGINIARADSGQFVKMGTDVLNVLDQFAAKITGELTGALGKQLHGLLAAGVTDLTELGQILGNTGHAVVDLAAAMPGLAEVLLRIVDAASQVILWISKLPAPLITTFMVFEEFSRWGGLAVTILGRLGLASSALGGSFFSVERYTGILSNAFKAIPMLAATVISNIGSLISGFGRFGGSLGEAGSAMRFFGADMTDAVAAMPAWEAALGALAIGGLVFLTVKALQAKDAMQQWAAATNKALEATSNLQIVPRIATDIAAAEEKAAAAQKTLNDGLNNTNTLVQYGYSHWNGMAGVVAGATKDFQAARQELQHLDQAQLNVMTGTGMLARQYQTTFIGALAIAQGAGVNLTNSIRGTSAAATDARLQIANYITGMRAMGESSTAVGRDVTLLGISSALTATKVSQLNQAVDQFVSGLTGGTAGLGALVQSILNVGQAIGTTTGTISAARNGMNLSLTQIQQALTNFGDIGSQVWQNFDQALSGSAEQLANWYRTAGAEGAVGSAQFTKAMQDIVAQFVPFAKDSKTAQAELVGFAQAQGLNVQTFPQLVAQLKSAGASSSSLAAITSQTTAKMSDMNAIAQALGSSIGTDVVGAMNQARIAASGLTSAAQGLSQAWYNDHTVNTAVVNGFGQTFQALLRVYGNTNLAMQAADAFARELGLTQSQVNALNASLGRYTASLHNIPRTVTTTVTTNYQVTGAIAAGATPREAHYQLGAAYVPPSVAVVGEAGPELVSFRGGETVTPSWRAAPIMRGAGGGGGGPTVVHSHVYIDGREVFTAVQGETYAFNRRNGLVTTGSMAPPG